MTSDNIFSEEWVWGFSIFSCSSPQEYIFLYDHLSINFCNNFLKAFVVAESFSAKDVLLWGGENELAASALLDLCLMVDFGVKWM